MFSVSNLTIQYSGIDLFTSISFMINEKDRIGLVGKNGTGKSTLFKMILGQESPDSGTLSIPKGYQIDTLEQIIRFNQSTVLKECIEALSPEKNGITIKLRSSCPG